MSVNDYEDLKECAGHEILMEGYGGRVSANLSIECVDCNRVLLDSDNPTLLYPDGNEGYDSDWVEHCVEWYPILKKHFDHELKVVDMGGKAKIQCATCSQAILEFRA